MKDKFIGINKAAPSQTVKTKRFLHEVSAAKIPCVFISYQRKDEEYAADVAKYIESKGVDVYFDLNDQKLIDQLSNPSHVTQSITKGLSSANYMLVIVSPSTFESPWVPFEVGYAFDKMGEHMKILRHKGIPKAGIPAYLKTKDILYSFSGLKSFIQIIRKPIVVNESITKAFSFNDFEVTNNPLSQYLED